MNRVRLALGGRYEAASTMTGTSRAWAISDHLLEGNGAAAQERREQVGDGGGVLVDSGLQLPRLAPAPVADIDYRRSGGGVALVVWEAVGRVHDDLVLETVRVGKPRHSRRVAPCHDRRSLKHQPSGCPGRHQARLGARDLGYGSASRRVEMV